MASLGEYLRQARERRGVTLEDVARVTRIRRQHLEALEADRLDELPAPPFVRGFLSAYAKQVGLAPDDVLARFEAVKAEVPPAEAAGASPTPAGPGRDAPQSPVRPRPEASHVASNGSRSVLVLVALVGVGALAVVGSMLARPSAPPVRPIAAPIPVRMPAAEPAAVPAAASPLPADEGPIAPQGSPVRAVTRSPAGAGTVPAVAARVEAAAPQGSPAVAAAAAVATRRSTLSLSATEDAWVQVVIDGGAPVEASLRPGDRVSWQGGSFEIVVGNAGGVSVELDGVRQPPLGESGRRVELRLPRQPAP